MVISTFPDLNSHFRKFPLGDDKSDDIIFRLNPRIKCEKNFTRLCKSSLIYDYDNNFRVEVVSSCTIIIIGRYLLWHLLNRRQLLRFFLVTLTFIVTSRLRSIFLVVLKHSNFRLRTIVPNLLSNLLSIVQLHCKLFNDKSCRIQSVSVGCNCSI